MTQEDLFQTATSSQQDTHASRSALPASDEARKMTVTSGRKYLPLCKQSGRVGAFSRTFLDTSTWASTKCYLTWKVKATPSNHLLFQLAPSMPRTDAIESGSLLHTPTAKANQMSPDMVKKGSGWATPAMWATPRTTDATGGPRKLDERGRRISQTNPNLVFGANLADQIRMWPTPDVRGFTNQGSLEMLSQKVGSKDEFDRMAYRKAQAVKDQMWPTPRASEYKDTGPVGSKSHTHMKDKGYLCAETKDPQEPSATLNPAWVEWLMGYPPGWTNLETSQE